MGFSRAEQPGCGLPHAKGGLAPPQPDFTEVGPSVTAWQPPLSHPFVCLFPHTPHRPPAPWRLPRQQALKQQRHRGPASTSRLTPRSPFSPQPCPGTRLAVSTQYFLWKDLNQLLAFLVRAPKKLRYPGTPYCLVTHALLSALSPSRFQSCLWQ